MKTGAELIADERQRQIEKEGWTAEHDARHSKGSLALAGVAYVTDAVGTMGKPGYADITMALWPFDQKWFKPTPNDVVRQLTKAGALIAAEIDRLQKVEVTK